MYRLRFDVETISKATYRSKRGSFLRLRFDVETISKATASVWMFPKFGVAV